VIHFLVQTDSNFASAYPGGKFCKTHVSLESQKQCFMEHCAYDGRLQTVHDFIMNKIPTLLSLRTRLRCANAPDRLLAAAAVARSAAAQAAAEPVKATMDDNLHCRVVQFVKWSQTEPTLSDLFNRYYGNEHSRNRHALDTAGFRSSDLLNQMTTLFNTSQ
jgi:hypothetical protein